MLSTAMFDDTVAWFENLGGGSFGPPQIITNEALNVRGVFAADLDGDGDADVLSTSLSNGTIAWHENLGLGSFGPERTLMTGEPGASSVYATDLDLDGDVDVVSSSWGDGRVAWYDNLGGGSFGPKQVITTQVDNPYWVYATDLDGDGDADVLSSSDSDGKVAWYENRHPLGRLGTTYCAPAVINSTGQHGVISATGSHGVADNDLTLTAEQLPPSFGYFLAGQTQGFTNPPGSQGNICLMGDIGRYDEATDIIQGPTGEIQLDLTSIPVNPPTAILPGDTWNFQCWYRDNNPEPTSNFTDAVSLTFQ
ncbi:MAG: hypothetical protein GY711_14810 [bacterium]|nr:hypothetical protein [bacterium]